MSFARYALLAKGRLWTVSRLPSSAGTATLTSGNLLELLILRQLLGSEGAFNLLLRLLDFVIQFEAEGSHCR